jgi:gamma-tubulin complex component 2
LDECQLFKRLESINHYFFFDRGDLFSHFYESTGDLLEKQSSDVKIEKLESCLEMAIRTSSANSDPFKDDLSCELNGYGVSEQLFVTWITRGALGNKAFTGNTNPNNLKVGQTSGTLKVHEAFTLDYRVKWPLTLIISKKAINKYQLIFRHLLQCKYAEKYLENVWCSHQLFKECNVQSSLQLTYALRHRMLQFCKNYMYYMQYEVLEPNHHKLKEQLKKVKTVDEIILLHSNFLDECLKECLLTDQNLFRIITSINIRTLFFSRVIIRFFNNVKDEEILQKAKAGQDDDMDDEEAKRVHGEKQLMTRLQRRRLQKEKESMLIKKNISENNYPTILDNFQKKFDEYMKELLEHLAKQSKFETHIANLAQRLDFNGFYANKLLNQELV